MARFGTKTRRLKTPAICKAPPPDLPPRPFGYPPPMLAGMAKWTDLDPLAPIDVGAYIDLFESSAPGVWTGRTPPSGQGLSLTLFSFPPWEYWDVTLAIFRPPHAPEFAHWLNVRVDPTKPFSTGLLQSIYIPGFDYRQARIMA